MHNVQGQNTQALPGYLGLSNTLIMTGRLSFPKPPHVKDSFAVLPPITDRIPSLEPGNSVALDPFRDPLTTLFFRFRPIALFLGPDSCCSLLYS